jgi:hypothetical protein
MDWDNEQICHWLTAVSLGEYVQVFLIIFGVPPHKYKYLK